MSSSSPATAATVSGSPSTTSPAMLRVASVQHYAELSLDGKLLILCHYPFRTWNQIGKGSIDLHGHSHGRLKPIPRQHDVGVERMAISPRHTGGDPRQATAEGGGTSLT